MPRKENEEDRIERIIRGLLKKPENRRCINCNSLGPQYVCTTFWTFVCTSCSGVHREFSHRVKSVSMAKFKGEEISALQAWGNERARQIYFKALDPQRSFYPDGSDLYKLREFIRHVYVDWKYAGQNPRNESHEQPPLTTLNFGTRDDFLEKCPSENLSNSSKDEHERHSFDKSSPSKNINEISFKNIFEERRNPHVTPENVKTSSRNKSRPARFEIVDDRYRDDGSVKLYGNHRYASSKETRSRSISPASQSGRMTSLPAVPLLKDKDGEKITEPSKAIDKKDTEGSVREKKVAYATSGDSTNEKQKKNETINYSSLIDFDAILEPVTTTPEPQAQPITSKINTETPLSTIEKPAYNTSNLSSMESLLFDLTAPLTLPLATEVSDNNGTLAIKVTHDDHTLDSRSSDSLALVAQNMNKSPVKNDLRTFPCVPLEQSPRAADVFGRKELPADLFSSNFTGFTPVTPAWQMRPPHVMGYAPEFHPPIRAMAGKPSNPFDIGDNGPQIQTTTFPSMSSLQGNPPNMPAIAASQPQQSPFVMNMHSVPGAYMRQQPNIIPVARPQGIAGFGNGQAAFASLNPIHQRTGTDSSPSAPNSSFSHARNPFG